MHLVPHWSVISQMRGAQSKRGDCHLTLTVWITNTANPKNMYAIVYNSTNMCYHIQPTQQMLCHHTTKQSDQLTESVCHHFQITCIHWQRVPTNTELSQTLSTSLLSCSSRLFSAACFLPLTEELIKVFSLKVTVLQHQLEFRKVRQMEDGIQERTCSHSN